MTGSSKVTIAIIGAGLIGPRHARTVVQSNDVELVAIVDPTPSGQKLADELNVAYYTSVAHLLQSTHKPDAAIICTPNHVHVPVAKELSSGGVHILIEKPVSSDIESGKELVKHLDNMAVKALIGHHRRFNPYISAAKEIISSGRLGNIVAINGLWTTYKPLDYFDPPAEWRRLNTGGVVLINMIHEIDLLHYLFGPIVRVHAEKTISQRGFEAEEGAALTLRFKSGVVGSFLVSDSLPSPYNFESGTGENPLIPKAGQDFYRIFGTDAVLSVPDMTTWSYNGTHKSWHQELVSDKIPVTDAVPFQLQLSHFVKVVRNQESASCTPEAGLAALAVCQAIKDALEASTTVDVEIFEF
ncbi:hypothetical protein FAVG1_11467 [Fusarium avenaceum]|nr:hypothetical protein FAVG1_11467 [Fusarium avenaceum]